MTKTGKKSHRGWWWDHFIVHPGYAAKESTSLVSGKAKVICVRLCEHCITHEQVVVPWLGYGWLWFGIYWFARSLVIPVSQATNH
jgi:hypothetical protein